MRFAALNKLMSISGNMRKSLTLVIAPWNAMDKAFALLEVKII